MSDSNFICQITSNAYIQRRREQNRMSQRMFRERKLNYVKGIEKQLEDLNEKYQDLLVSYNNQTKEYNVLLSRIVNLMAKAANNTEVEAFSFTGSLRIEQPQDDTKFRGQTRRKLASK